MDICHSENAELEAKHQKYKGRVVLRGDIVKDDSGSYAVFTEQGSSASQMTAAKVMDIISKLPGCAGQAADAVPAHTQVKMEEAPKLLKGERIVSKSRPAVINMSSYLIATSFSAASSPIGSTMNLEASSFDAASASQVTSKDAYLGGLKEEQQGNPTHEKEQISEKN